MSSIKKFKVAKETLNLLNANEKKLLPYLLEAVKLVDKIYNLQENVFNNGANFYPRDAIKSEIEKEAKKNPSIFSPFTIVKRNPKNKALFAINYHEQYKALIKPISVNLLKAARLCTNKSFKHYIQTLSESLVNGLYEKAEIAWLKVSGSNLDVVIGPYERHLDKLFFIKRAYQGSVGIIDPDKTAKAKEIKEILYTTFGDRHHRKLPSSKVMVRTEYSLMFSGFLGSALFTQQHLPDDSKTVDKYGSKVIGYLSSIDYKLENLVYPIFNYIFENSFKSGYSEKLLKTGNYYFILLSALVQNLHRFEGSRARLKETFPIYDQANSKVSGIQHSKHLLLKGVINQKELEAIMIAQICWMFAEVILATKSTTREVYLKGDAIVYNFLTEVGAINEHVGVSWPNFAKMFFEMENLASVFTRILEEGTYTEANNFLRKYSDLAPLKEFSSKLATIKPI